MTTQAVSPHTPGYICTQGPTSEALAQAWANYINAVQAIAGIVKHDERVSTGKYAYTYTSHEATVASTRSALLERGVTIVLLGIKTTGTEVVTLASGQTSVLVTIDTTWAVVSLGIVLYTFNVVSQAMDNTDKAYPKALTVAHRLALRVACYLGTTDDPERYDNGDAIAGITQTHGQSAKAVKKEPSTPPAPPTETTEVEGDIDLDKEVERFTNALKNVTDFGQAIALFNDLHPHVKRVVQPQFAEVIAKLRGTKR